MTKNPGEQTIQSRENSKKAPDNSTRSPGMLRRVPRAAWLSLSAVVLVTGSVLWHFYRQPHWGIGPQRLPEISGRVYGVGLQKRAWHTRVWIVGARGFLAYSDDNGQCWTQFEYDGELGTFHEQENNSCTAKSDVTQLRWPELVPKVLAEAPQSDKSKKRQQPEQEQSAAPPEPLQQQQDQKTQQQQQGQPPQKQDRKESPQQQPQVQHPAEQSPPASGTPNPIPRRITANAKPTTRVPPLKSVSDAAPRPPSSPPDLLAVEFSPNGKIVSTEGLLWTLNGQNAWRWEGVPAGTKEKVGGFSWIMVGANAGKWATETRLENPQKLSLPSESYRCGDCTIRSQTQDSETNAFWAAGWINDKLGDHAILLRSRDAGKSWEPITRGALSAEDRAAANGRPWMWPPNWYWAVLLLSSVLAAPALLSPVPRPSSAAMEPQTGSIEGRLSSDKPIDPGDLDVLGLTDIALGLSRFLRNEKTLPPLTIAISGEWGSGKSSLMNLLRCDLQSYGMRVVWFNAWHHQKEERLLAALLQTVRLEAVPPVWNLLGIPFRLKLLWSHVRRRWPLLVLLSATAIFLIMVDLHLRLDHQSDLFLWAISQILPSSSAQAIEPPSKVPVQGGLIALFATIAALWKGFTAFGANPAALLASVAKGNKIKDLEAQTSFRQKFAVEFRDFTTALGTKRPLVIFIDDLDRCLPGNVRDVLEAVNFLTSSGNCFVILGIDRVQVQRAIGLSFKKVAEEAGPSRPTTSATKPSKLLSNAAKPSQTVVDIAADAARQKRAEFAEKYLEKLFNLEVRVPLAIDDAAQQRLFEQAPEKEPEHLRERVLRSGLWVSKWGVPVALTVLLLIGAFVFSMKTVLALEQWMKENQAQPKADVTGSGATVPKAKNPIGIFKGSGNTGESLLGELISPSTSFAPVVMYSKEAWPARWVMSVPFYLVALFLLLAARVVLTTRPGVITHDSQPFTNAVDKVWYPLVLAKQSTPRAAKRFVNRVRYLAMRQRRYQEQASWWERVLFPQRLNEPAHAKEWQLIPEPVLVALAAVEQLQPDWLYCETAFEQVVRDDLVRLASDFPPRLPGAAALLKEARKKHEEIFSDTVSVQTHGDWKSLPKYRKTFLSIWPGMSPGESV